MEQRKPLRAISETSREAIATMSDIVWSIDARFDTLRDLIMRMKDYVYKLEDELEIMLSFSVKGKVDDKKVSQIVRQNLRSEARRVGKEWSVRVALGGCRIIKK